ncbi:hypothetical protein AAG570_012467 [Ranatra chinensis]|uniref:Reverse transcriptase domain-containing protein n=1 Tax=Ranatra chinensis TaxID=642074 RepID=A0ABD0YQH2_9HEMI
MSRPKAVLLGSPGNNVQCHLRELLLTSSSRVNGGQSIAFTLSLEANVALIKPLTNPHGLFEKPYPIHRCSIRRRAIVPTIVLARLSHFTGENNQDSHSQNLIFTATPNDRIFISNDDSDCNFGPTYRILLRDYPEDVFSLASKTVLKGVDRLHRVLSWRVAKNAALVGDPVYTYALPIEIAPKGLYKATGSSSEPNPTLPVWEKQIWIYLDGVWIKECPDDASAPDGCILGGSNGDVMQIYMDDIILFSHSEHEHRKHLQRLLHRFKIFGLKLLDKKSSFNALVMFVDHVDRT